MNDHDLETRSRAAAEQLRHEADAIADTDAALDALLHPASGWTPDLSTGRLADLRPFTEGWLGGAGEFVRMDWYAADFHLVQFETAAWAHGGVGAVHYGSEPLLIEDVNGADAAVAVLDDRVGITWEYSPGVNLVVGYQGTVEDALAFVRSLRQVDRATWEAAAGPSTYTGDGCNSMFC